jgi:glycosyltransferase involved in cell wall biosynthesis
VPNLSILLPTYNGAEFLDLQLQSILDQSAQAFRLLIVDDGSSDNTPAIIARAATSDPRVEVLSADGNQGQRRRLGQLAAASRTDLIAVADQDDVWDRDKLARLLGGLGEAALCFGPSHLIDGQGNSLGRSLHESLPPPYRAGDRLSYLFRPLVSAHALIARRDLMNPKTLGRALPFDWLMTVEAAFGAGLAYDPEARTLHRIHATNQSNGIFARPFTGERLISRYALRRVFSAWTAGRMRLLGMFEHLSFSDTVSAAVRRDMARAYAACATAWLGTNDRPGPLEATLRSILLPWAGSDADWAFAEANLQSLCSSALSPARLTARARRLAMIADESRPAVSPAHVPSATATGSSSPAVARGPEENNQARHHRPGTPPPPSPPA